MFLNRCPSPEALYQYSLGADSPRIAKHVDRCAKCRGAVAEMREDESLLKEVRTVQDGGVDGRVRQRLLSICRRVAMKQGKAKQSTAKEVPP